MKVRILRQPAGNLGGISLDSYRLGQVYDIPASVADYLVAQGLAVLEMDSQEGPRSFMGDDRRTGNDRRTGDDRRKFGSVIEEYREGKKVRSG